MWVSSPPTLAPSPFSPPGGPLYTFKNIHLYFCFFLIAFRLGFSSWLKKKGPYSVSTGGRGNVPVKSRRLPGNSFAGKLPASPIWFFHFSRLDFSHFSVFVSSFFPCFCSFSFFLFLCGTTQPPNHQHTTHHLKPTPPCLWRHHHARVTRRRQSATQCLRVWIMGPLKKVARHASYLSSSVAQTIVQHVCLCRLTLFIITFGSTLMLLTFSSSLCW